MGPTEALVVPQALRRLRRINGLIETRLCVGSLRKSSSSVLLQMLRGLISMQHFSSFSSSLRSCLLRGMPRRVKGPALTNNSKGEWKVSPELFSQAVSRFLTSATEGRIHRPLLTLPTS